MKPSIPKGTRDFSPAEMMRRQYIFDTVKRVFRSYGFAPLETPAMENLSTLLGKYGDEGDKLLFKILNSGDYASGLTDDEVSLVCETRAAPRDAVERDDDWRAFRVSGTLDLSLVGVLRGIADVLADIGVPVFVVSTYDTDYVLIKEGSLDRSLGALSAAGYAVVRD